MAAERLHPDHGADQVAVDVDIARRRLGGDAGDGFVDAGMHAEGQAVAGGGEVGQQLVQPVAAVAQHVQHRAEHLAPDVADCVDFDDGGRVERSGSAAGWQRRLVHGFAGHDHAGDMGGDAGLGLGRNDRADIAGQPVRITHGELGQRAAQHVQHPVGRIGLQTEYAERRAALAGTVEGGGEHIGHDLFGEGGAIDHQRVLPAGFGYQRHGLAGAVQPGCQLRLDQACDLGRAGEYHRFDPRIGHQRRADGAVAGQQVQRIIWHAGGVQQRHGLGGDQRGFLGRFGQHRVAGGKGGSHLAAENRQRKIPGADAGDRAAGGAGIGGGGGVIAQEIHRLADFAHRVGQRFAGFAHDQAEEVGPPGFQRIGRAQQAGGALRRRAGGPVGAGGAADGIGDHGGIDIIDRAHRILRIGGVADAACRAGAAGSPTARRGKRGDQIRQRLFIAQV